MKKDNITWQQWCVCVYIYICSCLAGRAQKTLDVQAPENEHGMPQTEQYIPLNPKGVKKQCY